MEFFFYRLYIYIEVEFNGTKMTAKIQYQKMNLLTLDEKLTIRLLIHHQNVNN